MKNKDNYILPNKFYSLHLQAMQGINFTQREIDIISCLLNGRASKKISSFLNISSRTVDTHIRNIMHKLECHSREGIIDFVEKCDQYARFKQYYSLLMTNSLFENILRKISRINQKNVWILLHGPSFNEKESAYLTQIKYHLGLVGIEIFSKENAVRTNLPNLEKVINSYPKENILCVLTEKHLNDLQASSKNSFLSSFIPNETQRVYYLILEERTQTSSQRLIENGPMHFLDQGSYFFSFFDLLRKILPSIDIDPYVQEFKPFAANDILLDEPQTFPSVSKPKNNELKKEGLSPKKSVFWRSRRGYLTAASLLTISLCGIGFFFLEGKNRYITPSNIANSSALITLQRPKLLSLLDDKLNGEGYIQTVALVGPGGSGKTFLARQYQNQQTKDNSWELNAETIESLKDSFENLAEALIKTPEDKEMFTALNNTIGLCS